MSVRRIRKPGIRLCDHRERGILTEFPDQRQQLIRSEGAVDPDRIRSQSFDLSRVDLVFRNDGPLETLPARVDLVFPNLFLPL